jgi:hypothetical protein
MLNLLMKLHNEILTGGALYLGICHYLFTFLIDQRSKWAKIDYNSETDLVPGVVPISAYLPKWTSYKTLKNEL